MISKQNHCVCVIFNPTDLARCIVESELIVLCVVFLAYCPEEFNGGIFWPRTRSDSQVSFSCGRADPFFESKTMTTRQCDAYGIWSKLDLTTCTLTEMNLTFVLTWFVLEKEGGLPPERVNRTELQGEVNNIIIYVLKHSCKN